MKVILLKDCKDGKANTIIEVASGYATNFLIKQGLALPYNEKTAKQLDKKLLELQANEHEKRTHFIHLKTQLEEVTLHYTLEGAIDKHGNLHIHKSISTKEVHESLKKMGFNLPKHALEKIHFVSEGKHEVIATLYKDIQATIRLEVKLHVQR